MENKTISYLNSKVWYRLVKVIYILFFVVVFAINNFVAFGFRKQLDYDKTLITCNIGHIATGGKESFNLGASGAGFSGIDFKNYSYKSFFLNTNNESGIEVIINRCTGVDFRNVPSSTYGVKFQSIYDIQRMRDILGDNPTFTSEQTDAKFVSDKANDPLNILISYNHPLFEISPKFATRKFLDYLIIGNFVIALTFVAGQKIFYYILLGNIKPLKK